MKFSKLVQPGLDKGVKHTGMMSEDPTLIKFSIGNPPPEGFAVERIRAISDRLIAEEPNSLLNYGSAGGRDELVSLSMRVLKAGSRTIGVAPAPSQSAHVSPPCFAPLSA